MSIYDRKLYALLCPQKEEERSGLWAQLSDGNQALECARAWWEEHQELPLNIAASSDRVNLQSHHSPIDRVKHPIDGRERLIQISQELPALDEKTLAEIRAFDNEQLFWWLWRFYPEAIAKREGYEDYLLFPAHHILPDCPLHSYRSTVSALVGAMYPESWEPQGEPEHPYLLIFTFSPVQEFIKASRKFVDFWAGSYLLHYLGAKLCWHIAEKYGPEQWSEIARKIREDIKKETIKFLENKSKNQTIIDKILSDFSKDPEIQDLCRQDLEKWIKGAGGSCWEWNKLWEAQIEKTWESYWSAVPLGNPEQPLTIATNAPNYQEGWKKAQNEIAPPHLAESLPTKAEEQIYTQINTGTWWGALQARLGQSIQAVKNTRSWTIPTAPGERSTLSGQFSAVHPQLHYHGQFKEGGGLSARSMRLFWRLMAEVYPGLFNGSEKLNAIELTKRMAWGYGGVAEDLGIDVTRGRGH